MAILFSDALSPGNTFFARDILGYWLPQADSLVRSVAQRSWPLWNPYFAFGAPMLADPGYQLLYPPTWLNLLLPPALFYKLFVIGHAWLGGLGASRLARALGRTALPAFAAGALYCASGPFVSLAGMNHHYAGASLMPWTLLALEGALRRNTRAAALRLGAIAGLEVLAGSGDVVVMTALLAGLRVASLAWRGRLGGPPTRAFATLALAAAFALAASAGQWLPTLELIGSTGRTLMGEAGRHYWSLHPLSLPDLFVPGLVSGLPWSEGWRALLYESREPFLSSLYLGAPAAVLAALALLAGRGGGSAWWLAAGWAACLTAALGRFTSVYPLLSGLPPLSLLRYPVKYALPAALLFALLASLGLDAVGREWSSAERRGARRAAALAAAAALALLAAGAALRLEPSWLDGALAGGAAASNAARAAGSRKLLLAGLTGLAASVLLHVRQRRGQGAPALQACLALLVVGDLLAAARPVNPLAPAALLGHRPPVLDDLQPATRDERLLVVGYEAAWLTRQLTRGPAGWEPEPRWALGLLEMLRPPAAARFGVYGSYDGDFTGLADPALSVAGGLLGARPATALGRRLLDVGNVGFVLALDDAPFPGLEPAAAPLPSVFAPPLRLWRVAGSRPRAYAVGGSRTAAGLAAFATLAAPDFDPAREVVIGSDAPERAAPAGFAASVSVRDRGMDRLGLDAELSHPGFVVVVEAYAAGWRATVDGRPAPVLRANALFRAVAVPQGRHRLELLYRPRSVPAGLALSALTLAGGLWLGWRGPRP